MGLNLKEVLIEDEIPAEVIELADKRKQAREDKNWEESDKLRKQIQDLGYKVEDTDTNYFLTKI